ncbi:putative cytochrome p450 3a5 protein [Eutypa lata UCREL1]|uniref:Putative cytochrome p450 3a5 protein n=1 Tax=Eutypa lata (strain UCR-EL1) TaxID=1287681 RepID=M7SDM7_EUTLA|nr:putative cytochrome p450 3a5 protein [Eutypa lata UCREL1]
MLEVLVVQQRTASHGWVKTLLVLFIVQYLGVKYYRIFLYPHYFSPLRQLPGPTDNHFFFGQALNLIKADTPTSLYIKWMREHPDVPLIRFLTFGNGEVVSGPINHDEVEVEGEAHRAHRKMINPAFSINNIRRLEPVFQKKAKEVTSIFERALEASNGSSTAAIDCTATFTKATLDVMGVALFGVDLSGLNSTQVRGTAAGRQRESEMTFHDAYDGIFGQDSLGRILMFANAFVPVRWLPLDANRKYLRATRWLEDFLTRLVRE